MKKACGLSVTFALACLAGSAAMAADDQASGTARLQPVVVRADAQFDFDQASLKSEDQAKILDELGKVGKVTWQSVNAVGYTDNVGSPGYNDALSRRRADAVKAYLVGKGVDASMISTAGKAAQDPIADNDTADGRARNRRTAIEFQGVRADE